MLVCVVVVVGEPSILTKSAFGELLSHTGSDPQPYAFAGEPLDPNSGWQYHRARWMDPKTGRLVGMDPFGGSGFDPATLHKYLYANADPANRLDPTGLLGESSLGGMLVAVALVMVISAIAVPNFSRTSRVIRHRLGATVHVWHYRGSDDAWGHASVTLSNGTHISWWPTRQRTLKTPVAAEQMPFLSALYSAPAFDPQTLEDDIRYEGQPPDEEIRVPGLDENRIQSWWIGFKSTHNWETLGWNCSKTAAYALHEGAPPVTAREDVFFYDMPFWSPNSVSGYAHQLAARSE